MKTSIFKKDSFNYRLIEWIGLDPHYANTTCQYFRKIVVGYLLMLILISCSISWVVVLILPFITTVTICVAVASCIAWLLFCLIAINVVHIVYGDTDIWFNRPIHILPKSNKSEEPSIIKLYLKSLHDKTCNIIEFD